MKKLNSTIKLVLIVSLLLVSAMALAATPIENISARTATALIQENLSNPEFVILDIRTPGEYNAGHITGARNIDFYAQSFAQEIHSLDREKTYLIYCRSGNRSGKSLPLFQKLGFRHAYHLETGINGWLKQKYPVVQ